MIEQATREKISTYLDWLLAGSTAQAPLWNQEKVRSGKPNTWNYIDGCMITAVLDRYAATKDPRYLNFADSFCSWFVQEDGSIRTYHPEDYNLDNVNPARNLITLYELTGKEKYRKGVETVRAQLSSQPRTSEGNFWHKKIYPSQVWLDGLYMAQPFYMTYETRYHGMQGCEDSFRQFVHVREHMRDEKTGLYYHGYDASKTMDWADPETGCSRNFWLRAEGWFACALVDTAEVMDEQLYYEYRTLQTMLRELLDALAPWQDASGMFYQVIDHPEDPRNYLETSGTALIAYAALKGARLGYLPPRYGDLGARAMEGILKKRLITNPDGTPGLTGICLVAGLGGPQHRDGSLSYYFSEPVVSNDAKGTAPFLLAYTELERRRDRLWK